LFSCFPDWVPVGQALKSSQYRNAHAAAVSDKSLVTTVPSGNGEAARKQEIKRGVAHAFCAKRGIASEARGGRRGGGDT
jgi:hypothetical protein